MKHYVLGFALAASSANVFADDNFYIEVLAGQTMHKIESSIRTSQDNFYKESATVTSTGFRLGYRVHSAFSVELTKQDYGRPIESFVAGDATIIESVDGGIILGNELDVNFRLDTPIEISAYKLGIKAEKEWLSDLFLNLKFGLAFWEYDSYTPQSLTNYAAPNKGKSSNDMYYGLGARYQLSKHIYLGAEYSVFDIDQTTRFKANNSDLLGGYRNQVQDFSLILGVNF